jgi:hypothetical protein
MKNLNFIIIFLLPFTIYCQNVISDTSYVVSENGYFYLNNTINYDDNSYVINKTFIGDTVQFYASTLRNFQNKASDFSVKVVRTNMFSKEISAAIRENKNIELITGKNPIDTLGLQTFEFLSDDKFKWSINTGSGFIPITFNITVAKVLRYSIDNTASRTMYGFGQNVIRLTSFPTTGNFLDLYWDEGRKLYVSQDGKTIIKKILASR